MARGEIKVVEVIGELNMSSWPVIFTIPACVIAAAVEGAREAQQLPHVQIML